MVGRGTAHTFDQLLVVFHDWIPCILNNKQTFSPPIFPKRFYEALLKYGCEYFQKLPDLHCIVPGHSSYV
jgi:hypothetical protein